MVFGLCKIFDHWLLTSIFYPPPTRHLQIVFCGPLSNTYVWPGGAGRRGKNVWDLLGTVGACPLSNYPSASFQSTKIICLTFFKGGKVLHTKKLAIIQFCGCCLPPGGVDLSAEIYTPPPSPPFFTAHNIPFF